MGQNRVLVVDDEQPVRELLGRYLQHLGYAVEKAKSAEDAIHSLQNAPADAVLTDVRMPGVDGMELLGWVRSHREDTAVVLITACDDVKIAVQAMKSGASDYLVKPFDLQDVGDTLERAIRKHQDVRQQARYLADLETALQQQNGKLRHTLNQLQEASEETLEALVTALDARERETQAHSKRVSDYSVHLARELQISEAEVEVIRRGSMLHDIGKIGIPDQILLKPDRLTETEWVEMRKHPSIGAWIVSTVESLKPASDIVITHHERFDGSGYPRGLQGEEIPLGSRIFSVADTLDAVLSDRPYRCAQSYQQARTEIEKNANSQFDPQVARCFLEIDPQVWEGIREASLLQSHSPAVTT